MGRRILCCIVIVLAGAGPARGQDRRPALAVFNLEDKNARLSEGQLEQLSGYLTSLLVASKQFQVVPRRHVQVELRNRKRQSIDDPCFSDECQIEIGKALAAEKMLAGSVARLDERICIVSLNVYDLRNETAELAAAARGGCDTEALVGMLERTVKDLARAATDSDPPGAVGASPPNPPPPRALRPPLPEPQDRPPSLVSRPKDEPEGGLTLVGGLAWTSLGLGAVAGGVATYLAIAAQQKQTEADAANTVEGLASAANDASTNQTAAFVTGGLSGALIVTGIVLHVLDEDTPTPFVHTANEAQGLLVGIGGPF